MDHDDQDEQDHPTTNHALHGEERPLAPALIGAIALVVAIFALFWFITWLRYATG